MSGPGITTTDPAALPEPPARGATPEPRRGWAGSGIRARILFWSVVTLVLAVVASVLAVRQVLFVQIDARIDDALTQEASELRRLAGGRDPLTGQPFGEDVERIFEVFLSRNVPARNEFWVAFIEGRLFEQTTSVPIDELGGTATVTGWANAPTTERGSVDTERHGRIEYLAVPVRSGERTRGVFVVAFLRDAEAEQVGPATAAAIGVGLLTLLIGSLVSWRVAEGVLNPVRATTETARGISRGDLARRIPVEGRDEISHLAATFNEMLDRLQEALETQRRFVDDAGHELRTPITIIRGHLELMSEDPEERAQTLALVEDELDRMQRIVTDLLTLAKAEQPDFLSLEPIDLEPFVRELGSKAEALGHRDWRSIPGARGVAVGDRQRLTQAVMQLAQNSVEHTREGALIELRSEIRSSDVLLAVRDAGEGIPPEELERIFRRFARGRHRRTSDGAGLGLSIVRTIAEAHGGRVEVSSEVGRGTILTLVLPLEGPHDARNGGPAP